MPQFIVERYEIHAQQVAIEADSEKEAIQKVLKGEGEDVENGLTYIETCEEMGMPCPESSEYPNGFIPSIRSIDGSFLLSDEEGLAE
jgi:hypothetical protein